MYISHVKGHMSLLYTRLKELSLTQFGGKLCSIVKHLALFMHFFYLFIFYFFVILWRLNLILIQFRVSITPIISNILTNFIFMLCLTKFKFSSFQNTEVINDN
jgi:hypothetical protein